MRASKRVLQIFSGQMQWVDIAARTLDPPVAQHNSEWQVLEVLMHWPWDRLVLSRAGMGVVQARALGISLAMAVARGCAPLELACNGTLRTEHLASGALDNAGALNPTPLPPRLVVQLVRNVPAVPLAMVCTACGGISPVALATVKLLSSVKCCRGPSDWYWMHVAAIVAPHICSGAGAQHALPRHVEYWQGRHGAPF